MSILSFSTSDWNTKSFLSYKLDPYRNAEIFHRTSTLNSFQKGKPRAFSPHQQIRILPVRYCVEPLHFINIRRRREKSNLGSTHRIPCTSPGRRIVTEHLHGFSPNHLHCSFRRGPPHFTDSNRGKLFLGFFFLWILMLEKRFVIGSKTRTR